MAQKREEKFKLLPYHFSDGFAAYNNTAVSVRYRRTAQLYSGVCRMDVMPAGAHWCSRAWCR